MTIHDLWNECVDKTNDVPSCLELYTKEIRKQMIEEIQSLKNPYPKDIFVWDNEEPIEIRNDKNLIDCVITRGRFNHFVFQIVENTRQDVIKLIKELQDDAPVSNSATQDLNPTKTTSTTLKQSISLRSFPFIEGK